MKRVFQILGILVLLGIVYLSVNGRKMQSVKTEVVINAPPEKVWDIVTDIESWQEWSPTINGSEGEAAVGSTLSITMMSKDPDKDGPRYNPKIIHLDRPTYFHWRAHMMAGFIFTNDKIIELEATAVGTKVTHTETFKGLMVPLMRGQLEKGVPPILNMMNEALKNTAEQ